MSDSSAQDKTERPSEQKIRKAREEGNLPRSRELVTALMMVASALLLSAFSSAIHHTIVSVSEMTLNIDKDTIFSPDKMGELLWQSAILATQALAPLFALIMLVSIGANLLRGGWNISTKAMMPKLSKLNPLSGIKRIFSANSLVELIKSILKVTFIGGALYWLINHYLNEIIALQHTRLSAAIPAFLDLLWTGLFVYGLVLLFIAVLEMPYSSYEYIKKLKMTKQEVKEEHKNTEGRPEIKARIRQLQRQMSQRAFAKTVPTADVIITNPTHYAVALKYDLSKANAPFVIAKGVDQAALQIRQIAQQHGLPVVEVPPLARAVYYSTNEWQEIPAQLYVAVAHVLNYVFQLDQYKKGRQSNRPTFPTVVVPEELRR
ncbi:flagellar biosynthesis protein FlhB [Grimontia hollisae]|uniref:Flagellar biosynthetic protein FlhB n=2 Tax=Grimontia hollisae TaxID=673 RepID=D0I461_GRIHO|nr:flagellar biosynthesis protein FlhB [Grimontia hollisae]AMG30505.1 flagellar biosynthesis protein FlhB [Grimontia hollisae]EEY73839.1 flagellar biosynthesis protein FlhB [Grimontia hollisae CIP 101886]MDF2183768.1 flagellar biosynthesis protein FlhB [Grimontia hollisae]STO41896.1 Flagellar biosynthetic protein flhB [Grimontia hollisae]STO55820.1 Flagellar biosynthetic protein flhB [Grimontia hollisae]